MSVDAKFPLAGIAVQMTTDLGLHMPLDFDDDTLDHALDTNHLNQGRHSFFGPYAHPTYTTAITVDGLLLCGQCAARGQLSNRRVIVHGNPPLRMEF